MLVHTRVHGFEWEDVKAVGGGVGGGHGGGQRGHGKP